ncbi:MAG: hypothetical protein CO119_05960 [Flavobacteriales bacterium CG_4_9_14_3_um_filter_40_17]|nr:MAG: hypothetical protein CO119_05960 [Flavobacteriales bacterium CG_4_9_14_3_um_filter_40_17]
MGIILFLVAILLSAISLPIGFSYFILKCITTFQFKKFGIRFNQYFLKVAVSIDQMGNVAMQELFNDWLIKNREYPFGNEDETISSVIGKNLKYGNLTSLGKALNAILNFLDPNHSLNSIEYLTELKKAE